MTEQEYRRRSALLSTVSVYPLLTLGKLRTEMEMVHGIAASADLLRADLEWLAEMGLLRVVQDGAQCTERGMDVARLRAKFPGWN